jgi:micrococcal nuclease
MSDTSQGPGWWRASDGRWYPPETHPQYRQPPMAEPPEPPRPPPGPIAPFLPERPGPLRRLWDGYRGWPRIGQIGAAVGLVVLLLVALGTLGNHDKQPVASDLPASSVPPTTLLPATTTSSVVLPAGTDAAVASIVDGDSFKVANATIRMTGIDAPDTGACLAPEATAHLTELIPAGTAVRLVYDTKRTDSSDRDLAYVYRISDGAFVNLKMVEDGYAYELKVPPNVTHAEELHTAVTTAQAAKVGVWASCSTSSGATTSTTKATTGTTGTTAAGAAAGRASVTYANCTEVRSAGAAPLYRNDPGYSSSLDPDGDGVACT